MLSPGADPATPPSQLLSPRVTALAEILEKADSCYWRVLQSMFRDVRAGERAGGTAGGCRAPLARLPQP